MMHRDLKSPNVLLSEEGVAKIADVGMVRAQVKDLVTAQPVMTPLWAAPEVSIQHAILDLPSIILVRKDASLSSSSSSSNAERCQQSLQNVSRASILQLNGGTYDLAPI